jgi:hypothetical protein
MIPRRDQLTGKEDNNDLSFFSFFKDFETKNIKNKNLKHKILKSSFIIMSRQTFFLKGNYFFFFFSINYNTLLLYFHELTILLSDLIKLSFCV